MIDTPPCFSCGECQHKFSLLLLLFRNSRSNYTLYFLFKKKEPVTYLQNLVSL